MSEQDMEPLSSDLQALLDAERPPEPVPSEVRPRLLARLRETIGAPPPDGGGDGGGGTSGGASSTGPSTHPFPPVPPLAAAPLLNSPWWLAAAFGVGAVAGAGSYAALAPEPEPVVREVIVEVPSQAPPDSPIPEPHVPDFPGPEPAEPRAEDPRAEDPRAEDPRAEELAAQPDRSTSTRPRDARRGDGPDEGSSESTQEERSLLSRAQTAIARNRSADALAALEEHGRRFPRGAFVEEREALKVQALLVGGRTSEARRAAAAFLEGHPRSIFRETVEAALGE